MKILFVCLGNICRSPMAEGIMKKLVIEHHLNWKIESAGTEYYHVGEQPDSRAVCTCDRFTIDIRTQRARRISKKDFEDFDVVYALAADVMNEIRSLKIAGKNESKLKLLLDEIYPGGHRSVPDPWYHDEAAFGPVFQLIEKACNAIITKYASHAEKPA